MNAIVNFEFEPQAEQAADVLLQTQKHSASLIRFDVTAAPIAANRMSLKYLRRLCSILYFTCILRRLFMMIVHDRRPHAHFFPCEKNARGVYEKKYMKRFICA